jgi:hypothetical protein
MAGTRKKPGSVPLGMERNLSNIYRVIKMIYRVIFNTYRVIKMICGTGAGEKRSIKWQKIVVFIKTCY